MPMHRCRRQLDAEPFVELVFRDFVQLASMDQGIDRGFELGES